MNKLAVIIAHAYVHELGERDVADIRRLAGPAQPCILIKPGDVETFLSWAESIGTTQVFIGLDDDALIAHGKIPGTAELPIAVRVEVNRQKVRETGLCGMVTLADLTAVFTGKPAAR